MAKEARGRVQEGSRRARRVLADDDTELFHERDQVHVLTEERHFARGAPPGETERGAFQRGTAALLVRMISARAWRIRRREIGRPDPCAIPSSSSQRNGACSHRRFGERGSRFFHGLAGAARFAHHVPCPGVEMTLDGGRKHPADLMPDLAPRALSVDEGKDRRAHARQYGRSADGEANGSGWTRGV